MALSISRLKYRGRDRARFIKARAACQSLLARDAKIPGLGILSGPQRDNCNSLISWCTQQLAAHEIC